MDSHKIFIDTDTEITFIIEKILEAKHDRVVIVVPDRASFLSSLINLKIVKRVVEKSKKLLIVVTMDEPCADLGRSAGLHVIPRIGEITEKDWDVVQKNKFDSIKKNHHPRFTEQDTSNETDINEIQEITDLDSFLKSEASFSSIKAQQSNTQKQEKENSTNESKRAKINKASMKIKSKLVRKRKKSNAKESLNFEFKQDLKKKSES
jgi:hypothetical protein